MVPKDEKKQTKNGTEKKNKKQTSRFIKKVHKTCVQQTFSNLEIK